MNDKMRILVAYDGSECADNAIENMTRAGFPDDVEATVLTVSDAWGLPESVDSISASSARFVHPTTEHIQAHVARVKDQARDLSASAARRVSEIFPAWNVGALECLGKPAWEIIEKADEWRADLIVVGSHGRGVLGRVLLGSVSQKVLNEARCSVRISRTRDATDTAAHQRVILANDGSKYAEAAIKTVAARSWPEDAEIRLVAIDDPFVHPVGGYVLWDTEQNKPKDNDKSREWFERVIETPKRFLREAGLKNVSHAVRWGDAGNMIINEADEWQADTIFMGARGIGRFQRFLLGSVSSTVSARAECSVEVVRPKEMD